MQRLGGESLVELDDGEVVQGESRSLQELRDDLDQAIKWSQRSLALAEEVTLRRGEVDEMLEKVKEARARRDALAAETGRTGARESIRGADDLFAELDRMAERIGDTDAEASAAREMDDFDLRVDPDAPVRRPQVDYDAALEELKRRMGRSD